MRIIGGCRKDIWSLYIRPSVLMVLSPVSDLIHYEKSFCFCFFSIQYGGGEHRTGEQKNELVYNELHTMDFSVVRKWSQLMQRVLKPENRFLRGAFHFEQILCSSPGILLYKHVLGWNNYLCITYHLLPIHCMFCCAIQCGIELDRVRNHIFCFEAELHIKL